MLSKRLLFFLLLLFLLIPQLTWAHTHLESSIPKKNEVLNTELTDIILTFQTKIEQGSTLEIQNAQNETLPLASIQVIDNQLMGRLSTPSNNGTYKVKWKIIGADGHLIEGNYTFQMKKSIPTNNETIAPKEAAKQTNTNVNSKSKTTNTTPLVIGLVSIIVVGIGVLIWIIRRKSNK